MSETKITTLGSYYERVNRMLAESRPAMEEVLPAAVPAERHVRTALTLWRTDEKLQACTPESFAGVVLAAAQLHLSLDRNLQQAFIIPRGKKVNGSYIQQATLLVGYPGIVKLARDTGQVADFTATLVHEHDSFAFALGTHKRLEHTWTLTDPRGRCIGGYLYVRLSSGEQHIYLMTMAELQEARLQILDKKGIRLVEGPGGARGYKQGQSGGEYEVSDEAWVHDPVPMYIKTMIRRGSKTIPLGDLYTRAVGLDEAGDREQPQYLDEAIRGVLPDGQGAPENATDAAAEAATRANAEVLAARIRSQATPAATESAPADAPKAEQPAADVAPPAVAEAVSEEAARPDTEAELERMQRKLEEVRQRKAGGRKAKGPAADSEQSDF